jgi:membrane protein
MENVKLIQLIKNINFKELKDTINNITLYSAAMSFYTIFSLVPLILIILSIFSSTPFFAEFYSKLEHFISSNLLPTNQNEISAYLKNFLTNSGKMGIMGGFYILITSILFFDNFEEIISKIFNQEKRNLWEKIKLYWTMLTLFPIMFAAAMYLSIKFQFFLDKNEYTSWIKIGSFAPFIIIWLTFFLSYKMTLQNEKTKSAIISSFIVTVIFFISKNIFIYYVMINKTYTTIYGSISLLMFLFLWIYINWIIYISGIYLIKYLDIISQKKEIIMDITKIKPGNPEEAVNAVIEIPQGSNIKYELDKESGAIFLDRILYGSQFYPANYGFVPNTLADDGDPIDILVLSSESVAPGVVIKSRVIGVLIMEDESGKDEKIVAVPVTKLDPKMAKINDLSDLPEIELNQIKHFFETYKDLEPGKWVKVTGFEGREKAIELIRKAIENYK